VQLEPIKIGGPRRHRLVWELLWLLWQLSFSQQKLLWNPRRRLPTRQATFMILSRSQPLPSLLREMSVFTSVVRVPRSRSIDWIKSSLDVQRYSLQRRLFMFLHQTALEARWRRLLLRRWMHVSVVDCFHPWMWTKSFKSNNL
jgi:hypothetical protein